MGDIEILAERVLSLRDKVEGTSVEIRVVLGMPYWVQKGFAAACPVSIEGLTGRVRDIEGIDFMNAIELSLAFVESILSSLPPGKEVQWPDGAAYP
jgi:hypothetical protein